MVLVKTHRKGDVLLVAVCDADLLGDSFEEDNRFLDVKESFYGGEDYGDGAARDIMRNADQLNIVGEKSVKLAVLEGLVDEDKILDVEGVPYAQAIVIQD